FLFYYRIPRLESINYYLTQSDELFKEGQYRRSEDMLEKSSSFAQGRSDWLRIIKRSYLLSRESGDWETYRNYAERAVKLYQGSEEMWSYYLTSLLWTGRYDKAMKYEERLNDERFSSIAAEIRLTRESLNIDETKPPYKGVLDRLYWERDADFYTLIGTIAQIDDLKADAVMLWMGLGEKDKALSAALSLKNPDAYPQILGLMYWDRGDREKALYYLSLQNRLDQKYQNQRWTLNNILGDGYFLTGDWEKAEAHYLTSLEIKGEDNWRPFVNRALLYEQKKYYKEASRIILEALPLYSRVREVVLYFLDNWKETFPVRAERVVYSYLQEFPGDVEVRLEQISSFPEEMTPEAYRAFLWELFNENSENVKVTEYLLWYMAVLGDFESMQIIMERHEKALGKRPDNYPLYEGLIRALKRPQDPQEAVRILEEYYTATGDWFAAWNLMVLMKNAGMTDEAETWKKKAERH
ncbi:MAG: tetratricopeptide repeat protein, partial [Spirochaetales bacterium]|nr:tetratricopeptide repeat protein [Spirochaetales bacterium]